ncbi:MAG: hypothetical protein EAZ91_17075 [Cytophagales bacterium]|nr:MAG: hypothetical protein EAZ91_17075 [Cytophagales bacterium]
MITEAQLTSLLLRLEQKIALLQAHSDELSGAVKRLQLEKTSLLNLIQEQRLKNKELQKKLDGRNQNFTIPTKISRIVKKNQADTADHTELKQKLDEYIREIEQVIAHLSTLS